MKEPKKGQAAPETAPNAYTRVELEGLSKSTGIPVEQLWAMSRRTVQQITKDAAEAQLEQQRKAGEENAKLELERARARDKVEAEKLEAGRPLAERYPFIGQMATGVGALAPLLLPIMTRRYSPEQKLIRRWDKSLDQAEAAQAAARNGSGTLADAVSATEAAQAYASQYKPKPDTFGSKVWSTSKDVGTVGSGVLVSTEAPMLPAVIDKFTQPEGSRAKAEADKKLTIPEMIDRLIAAGPIVGGISATGLKVGSMMNRNAATSQARTDALMRQAQPGWSAGPQTMGANYAGATSAELPLIDARSNVASARRAAELLDKQPPRPRGLLEPDPVPPGMAGPAQSSPPPVAPSQSPSAAPVAQPTLAPPVAQPQFPNAIGATGELPPAGPWANQWSPAARQAVEQHIEAGGTLHPRTGMTGDRLSELIGQATGGSRPSPAEARSRLAMMRNEVGNAPDLQDVRKVWMRDKEGRLFAVPAALATGATGVGLLANGEAEAGYYPDRGPRRGLLQLD